MGAQPRSLRQQLALPPQTHTGLWRLYVRMPASLKGSVRVTTAVTAICLFSLITFPLNSNINESGTLLRGGEWAAVTASLIPYSTIGEGSLTAAAQVGATLLGGFAAYAFFCVMPQQWALAFITGAMTLVFHVVGSWLGLAKSLARIATGTFIVVIFGAYNPKVSTIYLTLTRVVGISAGVLVAVVTTILVLPFAATEKVLTQLHISLSKLEEMNTMAWQAGVLAKALAQQPPRTDEPGATRHTVLKEVLLHPGNHIPVPLRSELRDVTLVSDPEPWHDASADLHAALAKVKRLTSATQTEFFALGILGFRFYLPLLLPLPHCMRGSCHGACVAALPANAAYHMRKHVQHAARLLWVVFHLLEHGFEAEMEQKWGVQFPRRVFAALRSSLAAALSDLVAHFPRGNALDRGDCFIPSKHVLAFAAAIESIGTARAVGVGSSPGAARAARYLERHHSRPKLLHVSRSLQRADRLVLHEVSQGGAAPSQQAPQQAPGSRRSSLDTARGGYASTVPSRAPSAATALSAVQSAPVATAPGAAPSSPHDAAVASALPEGSVRGSEARDVSLRGATAAPAAPSAPPSAREAAAGGAAGVPPASAAPSAHDASLRGGAAAPAAPAALPSSWVPPSTYGGADDSTITGGLASGMDTDWASTVSLASTATAANGAGAQPTPFGAPAVQRPGPAAPGSPPGSPRAAPGDESGEAEHGIIWHRMYTFRSLLEQLLDELVGMLNSSNELIAGWPGAALFGQTPPRLTIDMDMLHDE